MHIEIWKGAGKQPWRWHKKTRGRIVSSAEGFPSKSHAMRGAKAEVKGTVKPCGCELAAFFVTEKDGRTTLKWA